MESSPRPAHIRQTDLRVCVPPDRTQDRVHVIGAGAAGSGREGVETETVPDRRPAGRNGAAMDKIENTIGKGIVAGFVATFVLSVLLDPIAMLTPPVWPGSPVIGWLLHFFIGTVIWGVAFAMVHDHLPGASWLRGLIFAIGAWLLVAAAGASLIEARLLAIDVNASMILSTLAIHVLYGVTLGVIYGWLLDRAGAPAPPRRRRRDAPHPLAR